MTFCYKEKISIFTPTISDDCFLVIDHVFRHFGFPYLLYDPFFTTKTPISENNSLMTPFYSVRAFARIRQTLLLNLLGGRMRGPSPHLKFGGIVPQSPLGLRPCIPYSTVRYNKLLSQLESDQL